MICFKKIGSEKSAQEDRKAKLFKNNQSINQSINPFNSPTINADFVDSLSLGCMWLTNPNFLFLP